MIDNFFLCGRIVSKLKIMFEPFDAQQLLDNYNEFRSIVNKAFESNPERLQKLNEMYDHFEERMVYTPASSTAHFHNAFPGGYIDHVIRVTKNAMKILKLQTELGINTSNISRESLIFCALHHDLGKLGTVNEDLYILNDSEWHVKNQGKNYKYNPNIHWMDLNTRTFYLLNQFGIKCSEEEWIGIKLTDGMYDDDNKKYYVKFEDDHVLKTALPHILHQADINAARFEYERWKQSTE